LTQIGYLLIELCTCQ